MHPKQILPLSAREHLRPRYQRLCKWLIRKNQAIRQSSFWPRPAGWHAVREQLGGVEDSTVLYQVAAREFGILQVEEEIVPFLDYVAKQEPQIIGEIGLKHGGNSFMFLRKLTKARLYLGMDLVLQNVSKLRFYHRQGQEIHTLEGNSQLPAVVSKAERILAGRKFDFLFIDGDHEYPGVLEDLIQWYPLVRPGGLIAFHDIVPDEEAKTGVRPANSLIWGGGVHLLWARLKPHFRHAEFVNDWNQGGFGIGVLHKSDDTCLDPELVRKLKQGICE